MINWRYYPTNQKCPKALEDIVNVFESHVTKFDSSKLQLKSNDVLSVLANDVENMGFKVERSKNADGKVKIPVLFGRNGKSTLSFDADAYDVDRKVVLEVEAGRGVTNYQFLKDFFEACMMLDVEYFSVAVRNVYIGRNDFEQVIKFFDAFYASGKVATPLKGVLVIGY